MNNKIGRIRDLVLLVVISTALTSIVIGQQKDEKKPDPPPVPPTIPMDMQKEAGDLELEYTKIQEAVQSVQNANNDLMTKMKGICGDKFNISVVPTPPRNVGKTWVCQNKPTPSPTHEPAKKDVKK